MPQHLPKKASWVLMFNFCQSLGEGHPRWTSLTLHLPNWQTVDLCNRHHFQTHTWRSCRPHAAKRLSRGRIMWRGHQQFSAVVLVWITLLVKDLFWESGHTQAAEGNEHMDELWTVLWGNRILGSSAASRKRSSDWDGCNLGLYLCLAEDELLTM